MLPKDYITVRFPQTQDDESYQLLELPPEILAQVEGGSVVPLTIKGRPADDSVLCTPDKTYTLRSVTISNSLVILRAPEERTLAIRDICHEVLECVPAAGRVERVGVVLRESAWRGLGAEEAANGSRKRKRDAAGKRYTRAQLESIVQASDAELATALREQNVVEVDGHMLLLPPAHLAPLLSILLGIATAHGVLSDEPVGVSMRAEAAVDALAEHDVAEGLSQAVLRLFGAVDDAHWTCDVSAAVRELGRGLLVGLGDTKRPEDEFVAEWKTAAGEAFESAVDIQLLAGDYLLFDPPPSAFAAPGKLVSYFPRSALPADAATRFADLFLTRTAWRPDDMIPFLRGLFPAGDTKARDKIVAKFVRAVKGRDGTWWHPRRSG
ncbi:putative sister chromatid cohesion protein DCC1 [Vanrija pseudolonga]|uniref:Sister chromatid cohesion protein DCC1 n=1 Tax=Vanrija pseudolonga TaxID=143232 RepID=A0AAF0XZB1_9TREE|nr:putative sister chromatid cohesion protein DCC1 [Vanrija pseudolonga]